MDNSAHKKLSVLSMFLALTVAMDAGAIPVDIENPFIFRDNRDGPAIGTSGGDFLQLDVGLLPTDVPPGTTAVARNLTTNVDFPMSPCLVPRDRCAFFALIPHSVDNANAVWQVTATNGSDSDVLLVPPYGVGPGTDALPFAGNVQATENSLTPTFTWELPGPLVDHLMFNDCPNSNGFELNDCNVNRWRIRVRDTLGNVSNNEIFDTRADLNLSLPLHVTSFTLPPGVITQPGTYAVAVMLEGFTPFNRSRYRIFFDANRVPEPATLFLLGLGLAGLGFAKRTLR